MCRRASNKKLRCGFTILFQPNTYSMQLRQPGQLSLPSSICSHHFLNHNCTTKKNYIISECHRLYRTAETKNSDFLRTFRDLNCFIIGQNTNFITFIIALTATVSLKRQREVSITNTAMMNSWQTDVINLFCIRGPKKFYTSHKTSAFRNSAKTLSSRTIPYNFTIQGLFSRSAESESESC